MACATIPTGSFSAELRRGLPVEAVPTGQILPEAVDQVRTEIAPEPRTADELCDLLAASLLVRPDPAWLPLFEQLADRGRAEVRPTAGGDRWAAVERAGAATNFGVSQSSIRYGKSASVSRPVRFAGWENVPASRGCERPHAGAPRRTRRREGRAREDVVLLAARQNGPPTKQLSDETARRPRTVSFLPGNQESSAEAARRPRAWPPRLARTVSLTGLATAASPNG